MGIIQEIQEITPHCTYVRIVHVSLDNMHVVLLLSYIYPINCRQFFLILEMLQQPLNQTTYTYYLPSQIIRTYFEHVLHI